MQTEKEKDMATSSQASGNHEDEDYIDMDMEVRSSSNNFLCYSISSPPHSREFEFQMYSVSKDKEAIITASPADELFYKGKLLPLHLPPRLLMVQNLLQNSKTEEEPFINTSSSAAAAAATTNTNSTPLESCNVSPSESCRVSSELNPDEYCFEWSNELSGFIGGDHTNKSWTRKLKQIKKTSFGQKLKASRAYLKSLFSKSTCSDEFCAKAACNVEAAAAQISKGSDCLNKYISNKSPFGKIEDVANNNSHRKSFSGAIQRHSPMKCSSSSTSSSGSSSSSSSSSSFSFSSIGFYNLQLLKRSSSANSDIESSIEGAIAHCKQSQSQSHHQLLSSRKNASETAAGVCSLSASRISVCRGQERPGVCSI